VLGKYQGHSSEVFKYEIAGFTNTIKMLLEFPTNFFLEKNVVPVSHQQNKDLHIYHMIFKPLLILAKEFSFYEPPPGLSSVPIIFLCCICYDSMFQAHSLLLTKNSASIYTISTSGKSSETVT